MKVGDLVRWYCRNPQTKELYFGLGIEDKIDKYLKQALGKVIPELEPIFSQFGTNVPNVIMPVSIVSNYAMRKYGGNQNEALAAFVDDVSGQMEQQTNVPPSQGLMTSPQTT